MKRKDFIHEAVDDLMESDDFYAAKATALKPATLLKAEHRKALERAFQLEDFTEKIDGAFFLLLHNDFFSSKDKELLENEFFEQLDQLDESAFSTPTEEIIPLDHLNITYRAFDLIYKWGVKCLEEERGEDAESIFTLCVFLNPTDIGSWIGLLMAFFKESKFQQTIDLAQALVEMDPSLVVGWAYLILAKKQIDPEVLIDQEKAHIEALFTNYPEEQKLWEKPLKPYMG